MTRKYERMTEINSQRCPSSDSYRNPKGGCSSRGVSGLAVLPLGGVSGARGRKGSKTQEARRLSGAAPLSPKWEAHRTQLQFARAKAVDGTNYYYPIFSVDSLANKNQPQEVLVSQI